MDLYSPASALETRVARLERARRRERLLLIGALVVLLGGAAAPSRLKDTTVGTLTARRIVLLDHQGRTRVVIGEDPAESQRRSRSCGMTLFDVKGAERFGVGTFEDLTVVLGLDAPAGVGAPMPDRIGLTVGSDGGATVDLINNQTMLPVRLISDPDGSGGIEFLDYDLPKKQVTVTRLNHKGETKRVLPLGDGS
jgi:hypothetical protein